MKKTLLTIAAMMLLLNTQVLAASTADVDEKELMTPVSSVLMASTVKAGEDVKPVISGLYSNGCYRYSRADVEHDVANNLHLVRTYATVTQGMCLMVLVPFTREINIGPLSAGEHRVRFLNGDGTHMEKRVIAE